MLMDTRYKVRGHLLCRTQHLEDRTELISKQDSYSSWWKQITAFVDWLLYMRQKLDYIQIYGFELHKYLLLHESSVCSDLVQKHTCAQSPQSLCIFNFIRPGDKSSGLHSLLWAPTWGVIRSPWGRDLPVGPWASWGSDLLVQKKPKKRKQKVQWNINTYSLNILYQGKDGSVVSR